MTSDKIETTGLFFDGTSNRRHRVALRFADQLELIENDAIIASWPYSDIRRADGPALLRLRSTSALPLARLEVSDEADAEKIHGLCNCLNEGTGDVKTWRIVAWSLAAACSIGFMIVFGIPLIADRLAPLIPEELERRLGESVDKQVMALMGGETCDEPKGREAFAKLIGIINTAGASGMTLDAHVLPLDMANAINLPGGKIYLFEGLLKKAENPDEIAGILAHEIGHANHRDGLRTLIQTGGTSFLFGLLFGDITGSSAVIFVAQSLLEASHSREAESAADDFAVTALNRLGRSAVPAGELLLRITGSETATILDSHPVSDKRLERIRQIDRPAEDGGPILTDAEWQALKSVCAKAEDPVIKKIGDGWLSFPSP